MIKAVKVLNVTSVLFFTVVLLLIYGYLPISVDVNIDGIGNLHKHRFFYYSLSAFLGINIILRLILNFGFKSASEKVFAWMTSLIFILNLYLTFIVGFVGVWNNSSSISASSYAYLNYLGPLFVLVWVGGLIFLVVKKQ
ncbi:MAG: hypothetical protein ABJP45_07465 [Cyclobacteriaceae bacterium]